MAVNAANIQSKCDTAIRFSLYVLIFWLPYSLAVIETCVIFAFCIWFIKRISVYWLTNVSDRPNLLKAFKPAESSLNAPILFFLLACLLSVFGSPYFKQSLSNFFTKTVEWFVVYFLVLEVFTKSIYIRRALIIFLITAAATVLDSIIQFHFTYRDIFSGHVIEPASRATAGFKTAGALGGFLLFVIPVTLSFLIYQPKKFRAKEVLLLLLILSVWSLVVTFTRGPWLAGIVGVLFYFYTLFYVKKNAFGRMHLNSASLSLVSFS